MPDENSIDDRQCKICLDGVESEGELGRLIHPCLCKGTMSHVHIECLQKWRNTSASQSAFYACRECKYRYRFARTRIYGLATNPLIVGGISGILFTMIVMIASSITTYFMTPFLDEPSYHHSMFYVNPFEVATDLVMAGLRALEDGDFDILGHFTSGAYPVLSPQTEPGLLKSFIQRFIIGLPLVGAASIVHLLISMQPLLAPIQWLARYRGRNRQKSSVHIAAFIVIVLLIVGTARALYKVYQLTESITKRFLMHAEDAILEVNVNFNS